MRKRVACVAVPAERDLAAVWARTTGTLALAGGGTVRVVYPGRKNPEAGPDFVDAVLETDAGEVCGAVELHRRTSDWQRHGHSADPRYGAVVLHVVGRHDGAASRRPGGTQLPLLELATAADSLAGDGLRFPCAAAIAGGRDPLPALLAAGEARFRANAVRLRRELEHASDEAGREQVAYEALAETLGYSRNAAPMRDLARAVPLVEVKGSDLHARDGAGVMAAEALLLGLAGLLPSQRHLRSERRRDAYVEVLERVWAAHLSAGRRPTLRAYAWEFGRVRPENAPVRRVVALAHLAWRRPETGLLPAVRDACRATPVVANRQLAALVTLPAPPEYWAQHWDFGIPVRSPKSEVSPSRLRTSDFGLRTGGEGEGGDAVALIGPSRAADAVVNVLLPLAVALGELWDDAPLVHTAEAAYAAHPPLAENWITRLVRERAGLVASTTADGARHTAAVSKTADGARRTVAAVAQEGRERGGLVAGSEAGELGKAIRTAQAQQGLIAIYEGPCHDLRCAACALGTLGGG